MQIEKTYSLGCTSWPLPNCMGEGIDITVILSAGYTVHNTDVWGQFTPKNQPGKQEMQNGNTMWIVA